MLAPSLQTLSVVYKVYSYADKKYYVGVLPRSALTYVNGKLVVSAPNFGSYQAVYLSAEATAKLEAVSATAFKKKSEEKTTTTTTTTTAADTTAPTPGALGASAIGTYSARLNWVAATDAVTAASGLNYSLRFSTSNNLSTVALAEANGTTPVGCSGTPLLACDVTGLDPGTTYYTAIIVQDAAGNKAVSNTYQLVTMTLYAAYDSFVLSSPTFTVERLSSLGWNDTFSIASGATFYASGYGISMEIDDTGFPYVAYGSPNQDDMARKYFDGTSFSSEQSIFDSKGMFNAIAFDSTGTPVYATNQAGTGAVVTYQETPTDNFSSIIATAPSTYVNFPTLAIDSMNQQFIASANDGQPMNIYKYDGSMENLQPMGSTNLTTFRNATLKVGSDDTVHIVWSAIYASSVVFYNTYDTSGNWGFSVVSPDPVVSPDTVYWSDMVLDSNDKPHVIYGEFDGISTYSIRYTNKTGASWSAPEVVATVNSLFANYRLMSMDIDSMNTIHISYYSGANCSLYYNYRLNGSWLGTPIAIETAGSCSDSIGKHSVLRVGEFGP